jgi:hypothetical protein
MQRIEVLVSVMLARSRRASRDSADDGCTPLAAALAALPSRPLEMVAEALAALHPPEESLRDWAMATYSHCGGWVGQTLRHPSPPPLSSPHAAAHERAWSLEHVLSECGRGFDTLDEDADCDVVLQYLRDAGLANGRSDREIDEAIEAMEEAISSESFNPADTDSWGVEYGILQAATPDFTLGGEMLRLWFALEAASPTSRLAECVIMRYDGNFMMWACRTAAHQYLICFATS